MVFPLCDSTLMYSPSQIGANAWLLPNIYHVVALAANSKATSTKSYVSRARLTYEI